jgi:hypothetical protein
LFSSNDSLSTLIATHKNCINLWDLNSKYACVWSKQLNVECISRHPLDNSTIITIINTKDNKSDTNRKFEGIIYDNDNKPVLVTILLKHFFFNFKVGMINTTDEEDERFKIINKKLFLNINYDQKLNMIYLNKSEEFKSIENHHVKNSSLNNVDIFYCTNKMV